jgi:hypothetical protein
MNKNKLLQTANELMYMGSDFAEAGNYIKASLSETKEQVAELPVGNSSDIDEVEITSDNPETPEEHTDDSEAKPIAKNKNKLLNIFNK